MMEITVGLSTKKVNVKDGNLSYSLTEFTNEQSLLATHVIQEAISILTDDAKFNAGKVIVRPEGPFVSYMEGAEDSLSTEMLNNLLDAVAYKSKTHQTFGICGPYDFPDSNHSAFFVIASSKTKKSTYVIGLGRHNDTNEEFSFIINLTKALGQ